MSIHAEQAQEIARAINEVVGSYARRTRHWYDERDLVQRAWVVALETLPSWDPATGPLAPYLATALRRQLGNELVHDHAPVSAGRAERRALYSLQAASLESVVEHAPSLARRSGDPEVGVSAPEPTSATPSWADEVLADRQWHARVKSRLTEVVGSEGQAGLSDLLREGPRAAASGRPGGRLKRSMATACVRVAQDPKLRELLRERG